MDLKIRINFDEYFNFLEEYFEMFRPDLSKRKLISGDNFKL